MQPTKIQDHKSKDFFHSRRLYCTESTGFLATECLNQGSDLGLDDALHFNSVSPKFLFPKPLSWKETWISEDSGAKYIFTILTPIIHFKATLIINKST